MTLALPDAAPVTVSTWAMFQSSAVKVSEDAPTVVLSAALLAALTVTVPVGMRESDTLIASVSPTASASRSGDAAKAAVPAGIAVRATLPETPTYSGAPL